MIRSAPNDENPWGAMLSDYVSSVRHCIIVIDGTDMADALRTREVRCPATPAAVVDHGQGGMASLTLALLEFESFLAEKLDTFRLVAHPTSTHDRKT